MFELLGEREIVVEVVKGILGSGLLILVIKWVKKMILQRRQRLTADREERAQFRSVVQMMPSIMSTLDDIKKEVKPNGGSSLRDSIDRIESLQSKHNLINAAQLSVSNVAYWESDSKGRFVVVSQAFCRLLAVSESEITGSNWATMLHKEDKANVLREWADCIKFERSFSMEFRFVRPNKSVVKVEAKAYPLINKGQMIGIWGRVTEVQ
jgi:PAS domain S-box-containing protein